MAPIKVILLSCGSFNPPTNMHLRMFEVARDHLNRLGQYSVVGGIISPVHDGYGKKDLVSSSYRYEMLKLALQSSDWIKISNWECSQETWSATRKVLEHHQNLINSIMNNERCDTENANHINANKTDSWLTNEVRNAQGPVRIKLLCGADFLQSFGVPGLWAEDDIETIVRHYGMVVVSRHGYDPYNFIYESDVLTRFQSNIVIINEWVTNEISSSKVRRALRRNESVKYLIGDEVLDFIKKNGLYASQRSEVKFSHNSNINNSLGYHIPNEYIITPYPSDDNMKSLNSSGENIFLDLNEICPAGNRKSSVDRERKRVDEEVSKSKKVGFTDERQDNECFTICGTVLKHSVSTPKISNESDEFKSPEGSDIVSDESNLSENRARNVSRSESKLTARGPEIKTMNDGDKCPNKSILMLRRSNSDAVVSRRTENGETASVKIQFTKDGIKVISDKESIV